MKIIIIRCTLYFNLIAMHLLIAQVKVGSISVVPLNKRGHILNPTWSANNTLAFELIVDYAAIHLYPVGATVPARKLIGVEKSNSSVFGFSKTISSRLPLWSKINRNSIFFLYDQTCGFSASGCVFLRHPIPVVQLLFFLLYEL